MTKETVLTDAEIIAIGNHASAIEAGENGYILPIAFARAIEQALLKSTEVQALRKDAERYRWLLKNEDGASISMTFEGNTGATPYINGEELEKAIDSAMEREND